MIYAGRHDITVLLPTGKYQVPSLSSEEGDFVSSVGSRIKNACYDTSSRVVISWDTETTGMEQTSLTESAHVIQIGAVTNAADGETAGAELSSFYVEMNPFPKRMDFMAAKITGVSTGQADQYPTHPAVRCQVFWLPLVQLLHPKHSHLRRSHGTWLVLPIILLDALHLLDLQQ